MFKRLTFGLGSLTLGALLLAPCSIDALQAAAKQLKSFSPQTLVSDDTAADEQKTEENAADADPLQALNAMPADPDTNVQSYSIVTENRVGPDGKRVQKKKVWKNGSLVEEKEETFEGDDGEDLSAEMDGETIPGTVSRSQRDGGFFGFPGGAEMNGDMEEMLKNMEEEFNTRRAEIFRRFGAGAGSGAPMMGMPGGMAAGGFAAPALSEYWIGASVSPIPEEVAFHLNLNDGEGLLIRSVVPGSPAEKAGLAKYDVLLKIGDETISGIEQIGKIVDEAKEKALPVEFIRKGEKKTVELTPEKRPDAGEAVGQPIEAAESEPEADAPEREQIRVVRPGMIVPEEKKESGADEQKE